MHSRRFCVYNETRATFVSLGITVVDSAFGALDKVNDKHLLKLESGLWLPTSKVADAATILSAFDLLYLDEEDRVLQRIELSDTKARAGLAPVDQRAASALILAPESISSTRTLIGDQMIICVAEEMVRYLAYTAAPVGPASKQQEPAPQAKAEPVPVAPPPVPAAAPAPAVPEPWMPEPVMPEPVRTIAPSPARAAAPEPVRLAVPEPVSRPPARYEPAVYQPSVPGASAQQSKKTAAPEPQPMRAPEPVSLVPDPEPEPEPVSRRAKARQNGGVTSLFDAPVSPRKARAARPAWDREDEYEDEDEEYEDDEYDDEYDEEEEDELSEEEKEHSKAMEMNSWKARLLRWLVDLPTPARRLSYPGLVAFYWTGGAPQSYIVGNISATGVYLVTKERWTPGTVIMMTLQMTDSENEDNQNAITVMSQVVRWGPDGVGLQFVPPEVKGSNGEVATGMGADKKALEVFLRRVKPAKV